jgi:hypothetical protein
MGLLYTADADGQGLAGKFAGEEITGRHVVSISKKPTSFGRKSLFAQFDDIY